MATALGFAGVALTFAGILGIVNATKRNQWSWSSVFTAIGGIGLIFAATAASIG